MCFSAAASFTAGVLLTFVGVETLRKVHKPSQLILASIPVFFAFQQFTEGILWLAIGKTGYPGLQQVSANIFAIMAQVLWPLLVPTAVLLMEENKTRKKIIFALLVFGVTVALYYSYRLIFDGVRAEIINKHIVYQYANVNILENMSIYVYLVATIAPLFVSSIKRTYILGIIVGLSFIVSAIFYMRYLTSVWCFFAAVISFVIFYIIRDAHKKFHFGRTGKDKER